MHINPRTFMDRNSVSSVAKLNNAVKDMCDLYRTIYPRAREYCYTKWLALRMTRKSLMEGAMTLGIPNPELKHPLTRRVARLSDWICDYMELTPEEWGGDYFADAGLIEVHTVDEENH